MTNYEQWVRDRQRVEARDSTEDGVRAVGYVYAYTDRPTLSIVQPNGRRIDWTADLCVPAEGGTPRDRHDALDSLLVDPADMALEAAHRIIGRQECATNGHDWTAVHLGHAPVPVSFMCSRCSTKLNVTESPEVAPWMT